MVDILTKFKVLEVIVDKRNAGFNSMRVALFQAFPEMSWEQISSFVALLGKEGYLHNLYGDNELQAISLQPDAFARLFSEKESAKNEQVKFLVERILRLF